MSLTDTPHHWQREIMHRLSGINGWLIVFALLLALAGLINIHSATGGTKTLTALVHIGLGISVMMALSITPIRWLERAAIPLYGIGLILLVLVDLMGDVAKGAQRWLDLGFVRFQPSEIMKIAVPMVLALILHHLYEKNQWVQFPLAIGVLIIPFGLIAAQPDLGTALLVAASGFFVIYLAGLPWKLMFGAVGGLIVLAPLYWQWGMKDYQKGRVLTLIDPTSDPLGRGYHIIQSMIAIGSGGILGKGYGQGTQSQLEFLPEPHTDFAFAVIGEEWGFIGFLVVLIVNILLVRQSLINAQRAPSRFTRLLSGSLAFTYFIYLFINMGMVSGIVPVVGVPLPLISYGGTSALITFSMVGLILACGRPLPEARLMHIYRR